MMERDKVAEYLKKNPEFARKWVREHVPSGRVQAWVDEKEVVSCESKPGSTAKTKLNPPEPAQQDGSSSTIASSTRNSMTSNMFYDIISGKRKAASKEMKKFSRAQLHAMTEMELFMELIRDISGELDVNALCYKILVNVSVLTKSDRGSLFLVRGNSKYKYLVSKLFDVSENSRLEDTLHTEENHIRVPLGKGIAGTVAQTKTAINIKDAYQDPRFNQEVDRQTGYRTRSLLCMPICNYEGEVVGVAQIMNKTDNSESFTARDEELFRNYLTFCGIGLTNAQLFEMSVEEYKRNQMLLGLARGIFVEQSNLDSLVEKIMTQAQDLLKCYRCCVFLTEDTDDEEKGKAYLRQINAEETEILGPKKNKPTPLNAKDIVFKKAFDLRVECSARGGTTSSVVSPSAEELEKSKTAELAREVAASGEVMNIADVMSDPQFGKELQDIESVFKIADFNGIKIQSLLCLPIRNSDFTVIGVVQLINKINGKHFSETDLNIVEAFAIFCGLGIHNCQMYESACRLMAKQTVALEVLSYHACAPQEEVDKILKTPVPESQDIGLYNFDFCDFDLCDDDTVRATIRMLLEMNVTKSFHVPYEVLCRWTLSVKKNYRPVTYHNWRHALNVAQTMFTMLYTGKMARYMDELEMFGLVIASLCHDLDHRGTNNAFQSKMDSPLALLYGTSTMEHHHFDQCIMILNSEGNNIFGHMPQDQYRRIISVIEHAILATDLALYFKKRGSFEKLVEQGETLWCDTPQKQLLRGMMMTACDVAAITKPWEIQKEIAQLVAGEFFEQGDIERAQLHSEPIAMMDRNKKEELPKMQVGFIDAICMPVYKLLADQFPELSPLYEGCYTNRQEWNALYESESSLANETNNTDMSLSNNTKDQAPNSERIDVLSPSRSKMNTFNDQTSFDSTSGAIVRARAKTDGHSKTCAIL